MLVRVDCTELVSLRVWMTGCIRHFLTCGAYTRTTNNIKYTICTVNTRTRSQAIKAVANCSLQVWMTGKSITASGKGRFILRSRPSPNQNQIDLDFSIESICGRRARAKNVLSARARARAPALANGEQR